MRIVTINVACAGVAPGTKSFATEPVAQVDARLDRLFAALDILMPDVLCIQELTLPHAVSRFRAWARSRSMKFVMADEADATKTTDLAIAVRTHFVCTDIRVVQHVQASGRFGRSLSVKVHDSKYPPVTICTAHLLMPSSDVRHFVKFLFPPSLLRSLLGGFEAFRVACNRAAIVDMFSRFHDTHRDLDGRNGCLVVAADLNMSARHVDNILSNISGVARLATVEANTEQFKVDHMLGTTSLLEMSRPFTVNLSSKPGRASDHNMLVLDLPREDSIQVQVAHNDILVISASSGFAEEYNGIRQSVSEEVKRATQLGMQVIVVGQRGDGSAQFAKDVSSQHGPRASCAILDTFVVIGRFGVPSWTSTKRLFANLVPARRVTLITYSEHPLDFALAVALPRTPTYARRPRLRHIAMIVTRTELYAQADAISVALPSLSRVVSISTLAAQKFIVGRADLGVVYTESAARRLGVSNVVLQVHSFDYAASWKLKNNDVVERKEIICVSRIMRGKDSHVLLGASRLAGSCPHCPLRLIGACVMADNDLVRELEDCKRNDIVLYEGQADPDAIGVWYRRAVCSVLPSCSETLGKVIGESVVAGCPCFVSNQGEHLAYYRRVGIIDDRTMRLFKGGRVDGEPSPVIIVQDFADATDAGKKLADVCNQEASHRLAVWADALRWIREDAVKGDESVLAKCSAACEDAGALMLSPTLENNDPFLDRLLARAWSQE